MRNNENEYAKNLGNLFNLDKIFLFCFSISLKRLLALALRRNEVRPKYRLRKREKKAIKIERLADIIDLREVIRNSMWLRRVS